MADDNDSSFGAKNTMATDNTQIEYEIVMIIKL